MITLGIAGYSGSGKTTLVTKLIPALMARGLAVSTIKHTHHNVRIDRKGDLAHRLFEAGAREVMLAGQDRWALLHELRDQPEPDVDAIARAMTAVDVLLVEGFKRHDHDKIEVHRPALGKAPLWPTDPNIIAVASDQAIPDLALPRFEIDDIDAVADFVVERYGLRPQRAQGG